MALLLHPLHRPRLLFHPLSLLRQIEVQNWYASRLDVGFGQRVDHKHDPDGPLALPVAGDGIEQIVGVQTLPSLIRRHPRGHHELDVLQVPLQTAVDVPGQNVLQVLALWEELTPGQRRNSVRVRKVQLEIHDIAFLESFLRVFGDVVPDPCVGHVDGAIEVRGWVTLDGPQEGVELALLRRTVK